MSSALPAEQKFDLTILAGAFVALCWILYVDPVTGDAPGLVLGSLAVLCGAYLYVEPDQYVVQSLLGLAAVALGGAAPATILYGTPAGDWLVGSRPLPLALGFMLVVVVTTIVVRRHVRWTAAPDRTAAA